MSELKINGKIKVILEAQTFDSGFTKREFVVTTLEQYPQDVKLEVTQERVKLLDNLKVNDNIDVFFNVRGNEYNGRYFVNLQAWKIEEAKGVSANSAPTQQEEPDDGLPF